MALELVQCNPHAYEDLPLHYQQSKKIAMESLKRFPHRYSHLLDKSLKGDRDIIKLVLSQRPSLYHHINDKDLSDPEYIRIALTYDYNYQYIPVCFS